MGFVGVGRREEVPPGGMKAFEVDGYAVTVADVGGELRAFQDECTHQTCSLAEGDLEDGVIVCLCHNGEFDPKTGAVLGGPPPAPLRTHEVRVQDGELQVDL